MNKKLSNRTNKLRDQLASFAGERLDFMKQMKDLEAEMTKEKSNMSKIKKGLKSNGISPVLSELELDIHPVLQNNSNSTKKKNCNVRSIIQLTVN